MSLELVQKSFIMASMAAMAAEPPKRTMIESSVKSVQLDGQVMLKIIQHCSDALPNLVTGQLLGLDVGFTLEITDCFPFPVSDNGHQAYVVSTRAAWI